MAKSMTIHKGDKVKVIAGKDKGKESRVLRAYPFKERIVVERVNMIKKHARPTQKNPQGGILEIEGTIHVSNVMLVCPNCSQATRVSRKREEGVRVRVCKKCGNAIDK
ncbi:MAG: 50S ribosomal protein L24 [Actinomycetota bacterium]|jgi:large subunit ribosomal protein L24|nr:50S ribosomal protein L24 [Actinomycetota bacterium]